MSDREPWVPGGFDPTAASVARVWDFLQGGKDNYRADREQAARLIQIVPQAAVLAREDRAFLARAVTWLAGIRGIGQFIDLGCGLPTTPPSVHQAARLVRPGTRVAYVDNDPVVTVHARALLGEDDRIAVIDADIRDPLAILGRPELAGVLDLQRPAGVIAGMILHFLPHEEARRICAELAGALAPGSYLVVSVGTGAEETRQAVAAEYEAAPLYRHTPADIATFLAGLELAPPGIVLAGDWSPGADAGAWELPGACVLGAVGRVPQM
jgi:O-methyltransferase involved in polyketide biosynthesis